MELKMWWWEERDETRRRTEGWKEWSKTEGWRGSLWKEEKKRMEERIAKHKPRSVLTKEKKYTSLHVREAVGKNRKKITTGE